MQLFAAELVASGLFVFIYCTYVGIINPILCAVKSNNKGCKTYN